VDHICPKCAAPVDYGKPFCPQCSAPQIRVAVQPASTPSQQVPYIVVPTVNQLSWRDTWRAALAGGLCCAFAFAVGLGFLGLGMMAGGIISVSVFHRRRPDVSLSTGSGARLGALAGFVGFVLLTTLAPLLAFGLNRGQELRQFVLDILQRATTTTDPEFAEAFKQYQNPEGRAILIAAFLLGLLVLFVTFASLGGAIGAALARRKRQ
jgi:hypothetical protein